MAVTSTRLTKIARVIVPVSDQDRALEFYVGTLGFEKIADIPYGDGERWVEVAPPEAGTAIALAPPMNYGPGVPTGISFRTPEADALHSDLKSQGVDVDPEVTRMGGPVPPMFFFRDADGNILHVTEEI